MKKVHIHSTRRVPAKFIERVSAVPVSEILSVIAVMDIAPFVAGEYQEL